MELLFVINITNIYKRSNAMSKGTKKEEQPQTHDPRAEYPAGATAEEIRKLSEGSAATAGARPVRTPVAIDLRPSFLKKRKAPKKTGK